MKMSVDNAPAALWVVPVADFGGVARHVLDVTRSGIPGWDVIVLCPEGALADRLRAQGTRAITGGFGTQAGVLTSRRALSTAVRETSAQVVHSHLAYADIVSATTRFPSVVRRFTTEHGIAGDDGMYHRSSLQAKVMARVHRWRFRRFDGAIAVSHATRDAMVAKWRVKRPISVIPNGVELPVGVERRDPASIAGLNVLSLSRLAPEKRIDDLLGAFAIIAHEYPAATLTVAGEGPSRSELAALAQRLGVEHRVRFPGFADPEIAMAGADVVVQLSSWENCSYTLLDAVARGMRVVASDVGGNNEIVDAASLVHQVSPATVAEAVLASQPSAPREMRNIESMCADIARAYEGAVAG